MQVSFVVCVWQGDGHDSKISQVVFSRVELKHMIDDRCRKHLNPPNLGLFAPHWQPRGLPRKGSWIPGQGCSCSRCRTTALSWRYEYLFRHLFACRVIFESLATIIFPVPPLLPRVLVLRASLLPCCCHALLLHCLRFPTRVNDVQYLLFVPRPAYLFLRQGVFFPWSPDNPKYGAVWSNRAHNTCFKRVLKGALPPGGCLSPVSPPSFL